ncbi:MAG TPA: phosphoribosylformylglycinamidine cyclo-ligase [Clostridiaceae bacterium]|nr:phosphoribosylformylglycinamidine cyclo-ligase [Clostridiaceae bacterium]
MHADGAGTKSAIAYMMAQETGKDHFYQGIAQDSLVMNIDDLGCIGATDHFYLSNTIGRNAHRVSGAAIAEVIRGYDTCIEALGAHGVKVTMTGGETADVGDLVQTLIVDSTVTVRLPRREIIDVAQVKPGLAIVGLSSTGQTIYETKQNSGMSSNGLTASRHLLLHHDYLQRYPETVSSTLPDDKIYCGTYYLHDCLPQSELTVGEALLSPTRTYLPVLKSLLPKFREHIYGMVHCTGGGQVKCRDFGTGIHYIKDRLFPIPALFAAIFDLGEVPAAEMYQIFNMGHRLEIYCDEVVALDIIEHCRLFQLDAQVIGHTEKSKCGKNHVTICSELGNFKY